MGSCRDLNIFSFSSAWAVILSNNHALSSRQHRMARIGPGHRCQNLDHALCSIFATGKVFHISDQDIRIAAHMQMTALAFHVDAAGLLRHSVVIPYIEDPQTSRSPSGISLRTPPPSPASSSRRHGSGNHVPDEACDPIFLTAHKIFPDHIGKPKYKDRSVTGLLRNALHGLKIQRHIFLQRVTAF